MSDSQRLLHLNLFGLGTGRHEASWRHPTTDPLASSWFDSILEMAKLAERGKFDALFLADSLWAGPITPYSLRNGLEPLTLLSALAVSTEHIGLIGSVSTSFTEPFNTARQLASLDHLSGGRAGWNIVTSSESASAFNFGADDHLPHDIRYDRATEFIDVALALWDSWQDGAIVADKGSGIYADTSKVRQIDHAGEHFHVRGPLNIARSPQERPLLVQAGTSEPGRTLGARYADGIFTAQPSLPGAQELYADFRRRVVQEGRQPDDLKILPGVCPVIGGTEAEARELLEELNELAVPEFGLASLKNITGIDLSHVPLDDLVPADAGDEAGFQGLTSRRNVAIDMARQNKLTVRQLLHRFAAGFGHRIVLGTPEQIADEMEHWFVNGGADGYNVMPMLNPEGLVAFVEHVVPELQRRGIFRHEYSGTTLREHYAQVAP